MLGWIITIFLLSLSTHDVGVYGEVSLYAPGHITVDIQGILVLECTFSVSESSVKVDEIEWARQKEYEADFTVIAETPIESGEESVYRDASLMRRANSSVVRHEDGNTTVSLWMPTECGDTAMYRCAVVLQAGPPPAPKVINVTILENPQILYLQQPRMFECVTAEGIPAGELRWVMVRRIGNHLENITMGGMTTQRPPSSSHCSRSMSSVLSTETTADDETIICMVMRDGKIMDKKEMPIRMPYAVKNVAITSTVAGRRTARPEISVEEGQVVMLNCSARGRPDPSFKWRHWIDSDKKWILLNNSAQQSFVMQNVDNSKAGKYGCIAENFVRGAKHTQSSEIVLRVKRRLDTPRNMESHAHKITMIILFVAVVLVIVCIGICVIVFFGRRKRKEKKRRKPIYNVEMEYRPIVRNSTRRSFSVPPPLLAHDDFMI